MAELTAPFCSRTLKPEENNNKKKKPTSNLPGTFSE